MVSHYTGFTYNDLKRLLPDKTDNQGGTEGGRNWMEVGETDKRKEREMKDVAKLSAKVSRECQIGDLVEHRSGHVTECFHQGP